MKYKIKRSIVNRSMEHLIDSKVIEDSIYSNNNTFITYIEHKSNDRIFECDNKPKDTLIIQWEEVKDE